MAWTRPADCGAESAARGLVVSPKSPGSSGLRSGAHESDSTAGEDLERATTRATGRRTVGAMLAILVAVLVGGCASSATGMPTPTPRPSGLPTVEPFTSVPPSVSAILDPWRAAGIACGDPNVGMPENEPQWSCQGTLRSVRINIAFMADSAGLMDMEGQVPSATDAKTAKGVFDDLTAATPVFSSAMPAIRQWIQGWNGSRGLVSTDIPSAHVSIESDAIWITLTLARVPRFGSPTPGSSV